MEDFEFKAPMYVNFVESLDENDGADTFFDCEDSQLARSSGSCEHVKVSRDPVTAFSFIESETMNTKSEGSRLKCSTKNYKHIDKVSRDSVNSVESETMNTTITLSYEQCNYNGELQHETADHPSENVNDILNLAMKNLWTASKPKRSQMSHKHDVNASPKAKGRLLHVPDSHYKDDHNNKRKGSPMLEHCQPSKFISMAEAVRQFQTNTPDRFHSRPKSAANFNTSMKFAKGVPVRNSTIPLSPHLTSHLRSRPVYHMTREEEQEKEVEEMKAFRVKANPLNPKVLEAPKLGKRVERKPPTVPVPFKLTEIVKKKMMASPVYTFTANPVPAAILKGNQGVPKKKELPLTEPVSPVGLKKSKVYVLSLDVKEGVKCLTEKPVHHFGIPTVGSTERKHTTEVQPFSFEERDKLLLRKKEETIQKYLQEEKKSREFHAQPVPACIKSPNPQKQGPILSTQPVPFSFEADKRGMTRQEQIKLKLTEEAKELQQAVQFKARPATVITKKPFEPKKTERPLTDITAFELNTERRAKEREDFDCRIKKEQSELDELRKLREEERNREELEEIARIRKESVHKANPVRRFKQLDIVSSDKPLTDPHSPAFINRSKTS